MNDTAVLLCGHGSRDPDAIGEFEVAAAALRRRLASPDFATGYLEFARPTIQQGLAGLAARGARRILAVPGMLFAASHVKNDLPWEMNSFMAGNSGIEVKLGRDLAIDPKLLAAAADRIASVAPDGREDSVLVVVGRGTNDPDANSNISKITRMLWEGMGFGWGETAYSGVAHPRVDAALDRAAQLGFRRIVVFPYFLFTGVLVKRIYAQTDQAAARFPGMGFVKAPYLRDHPKVIDAFVERVVEIEGGDPNMN
ncbi:MAG: sirohydrochlorin chelatase [Alphaproteobacteria bacterium]|nr:MAG: sirohydrochlorin chelatase [Alphaproteobacteria bacterium]